MAYTVCIIKEQTPQICYYSNYEIPNWCAQYLGSMLSWWRHKNINMTLYLLSNIYDVADVGTWQTVSAMLHQIFNDITKWNSFNRNLRLSQANNGAQVILFSVLYGMTHQTSPAHNHPFLSIFIYCLCLESICGSVRIFSQLHTNAHNLYLKIIDW